MTMPERVAYATNTAARLRSEGADIVVCLTHIGTAENDVKNYGSSYDIAKGAFGIDVILDGNKTEDIVPSPGMIPISSIGDRGEQVGVIKIYRENDILTAELSVINKSETLSIAPDKNVADVLIACQDNADRTAKTVVAVSPVSLNDYEKEVIRSQESVIADMVTDSMCWASGAEIAFCNAGNVRGPIVAGNVTLGTISGVLPYPNILMVADVKGSVIREALQYSASLYGQNDGGFMQVSGCSYTFDPLLPEGERLLSVTVGGKNLDDNKLYSVVTFDFLASGGDGYTMLEDAFTDAHAAGTGDISQVFADYLTQITDPAVTTQGRIVILPGGKIPPEFSSNALIIIIAGIGVAILIGIMIYRNRPARKKK
jgi:5'-nucleotidase